MAFLPSPPAPRINYDADGSVFRTRQNNGSLAVVLASGEASKVMDDDHSTGTTAGWINGGATQTWSVVFPVLRDILGVVSQFSPTGGAPSGPGAHSLETSVDTTDGVDGVWVVQIASLANPVRNQNNEFRTSITATNYLGIKGIRVNTSYSSYNSNGANCTLYTFHLYGFDVSDPTGLAFWHPTLNQRLTGLDTDFEDLSQGTVKTKTLRLRNFHATQMAQNVTLSHLERDAASLGMSTGLVFSLDNITFVQTLTVGDIAAGAISPLIYVRRTTTVTEALGPNGVRLTASAAAWV